MHLGIFIFVILGLTIGFQGIKKEPVIIVSGKKIYEEEYNFLKRVSTGYMETSYEKSTLN